MEPRNLSNHVSYRAGRGIEEVARRLDVDPNELIKLSSNENVLGPAPEALEILREESHRASVYPKASHTDLTEELAKRWALQPEQVWLSGGADGAIDCLSRAMIAPGDTVLVPDPGFAYYAMSARYLHGQVKSYPVARAKESFQITPENILTAYDNDRIIFVNTPHNPTGAEIGLEGIRELAERTDEQTLIVVDEAYMEFSDRDTVIPLIGEREDVAILRTFSKAYGLAGLRIGYALVPESWADVYAKIRTPFAAGELACRAALAALEDRQHLEKTLKMVQNARQFLHDQLETQTWHSGGNFVLAGAEDAESITIRAQEKGVIIRDCTSFGLPDCIRITCGTQEMMERTVEVLNDFLCS